MTELHNRRRLRAGWIGAAGVALLLAASPAWSSLVVRMNLDELVAESDSVVEGTVEAVYSQWDTDRRLVFTYASVRVDDPLKGQRRRALLIRQLGGRVGSLRMTVAGMPEFAAGERVIVFLKDSGNGTYHVVGMNQGRYAITGDFAVSNLSGVDLLDPKAGVVSGASLATRVEVEEFKQRIRELAQ